MNTALKLWGGGGGGGAEKLQFSIMSAYGAMQFN